MRKERDILYYYWSVQYGFLGFKTRKGVFQKNRIPFEQQPRNLAASSGTAVG